MAYQPAGVWQRVETYPPGIGGRGCRQAQERVYQDGQLVRKQMLQFGQ